MNITLQRQNDAVHFEGRNAEGLTVQIDGSASVGGEDQGVRPMELMLMSLAGCSSIDVVSILKKMKQPLQDMRIEVRGDREAGAIPAVFTAIHLHYHVYGNLDPGKVEKAIHLSMTKYCSATKMLEKAAPITHEYTIHPATD